MYILLNDMLLKSSSNSYSQKNRYNKLMTSFFLNQTQPTHAHSSNYTECHQFKLNTFNTEPSSSLLVCFSIVNEPNDLKKIMEGCQTK